MSYSMRRAIGFLLCVFILPIPTFADTKIEQLRTFLNAQGFVGETPFHFYYWATQYWSNESKAQACTALFSQKIPERPCQQGPVHLCLRIVLDNCPQKEALRWLGRSKLDPNSEPKSIPLSRVNPPRWVEEDGIVVLSFDVDVKGDTSNIKVVEAPSASLADSAVEYLTKVKYIPGRRNYRDVPVENLEFKVEFKYSE